MPFVSDRWGVEVRWFHAKISHAFPIPSSCQFLHLSVLATVPRILIRISPSHVKILFHTDEIESTEWQYLVPRQQAGDCLLIYIPHWGLCDQPFSSHRTSLHEVELRQCVFWKRLLLFLSSSIRLLESDWKHCVSLILMPLSSDVPNLSPENCAGCLQFCVLQISVNSSLNRTEDLPTGRPIFSCHPSFCFGLLKDRTCFRVPFRQRITDCFQKLLPLLFSTSLVVAMLKTKRFQNWWITLERQEVRSCPFCR